MKKLWRKIKLKVPVLFSKFKKTVENNIEPAIKVVNLVKDAVENPAANIIVAITPFNWDDEALKIAKMVLPKVLIELNIVKSIIGKPTHEAVKAIVEEIRQYTPDARARFYEDLAVKVAYALADGKISGKELGELASFIYNEKFRNK